jgi:transcription elongation GreA/GreB family factor
MIAVEPGPIRESYKGPACVTIRGRQLIEERITDIRERRLAELRPLLVEHERDERYVTEFENLLEEAARWEAFLSEAKILDPKSAVKAGRVDLGVRARIRTQNGDETWVIPVHPVEGFLDDERISAASPLGSAILGARKGETVEVDAPVGTWQCTILDVARESVPRK